MFETKLRWSLQERQFDSLLESGALLESPSSVVKLTLATNSRSIGRSL